MKPTEEKAIKLVKEGRCHVRWVNSDGTAASGRVDGDHDTYQVSFDPTGRICTCPAGANHRTCSHGLALELRVLAGDMIELELV